MKIHKKLMLMVGMGMLLILLITLFSLRHITAGFSHTSRAMGNLSFKSQQLWVIERRIDEISHSVIKFVMTGDPAYRTGYQNATSAVYTALTSVAGQDPGQSEKTILAAVTEDVDRLKLKADRIFSLAASGRAQGNAAANLLTELDSLKTWIKRDIIKYQEANAAETDAVMERLHRNKTSINVVFLVILLTSLGSLFAFAAYINRKITVPLNNLWEGTEEISRGNLDYRVQVDGFGDIGQLSARFNEMAHKLRASYAELEQKLFERTHELASLDAVALTLNQAGTLKDMLDKSLLRIMDSLSGIQPKGGVFLCEPGGETLRLVTQKGLSPEFVQREAVIGMGECLCGIAARSGELLYSNQGCKDPRHTRAAGGEINSHIIIPIKSRGIVLGVVFLYPQKDFKLKPSDIQMLEAIGAQLGMAVENFRFYAEVKESSEKYWDLFENARDILFTIDSEGRLTAVNKAAELFTGYSKVELSSKTIFDFLPPEGAEAARRQLNGNANGNPWTEFEIVRKDGTTAFIEVSVRRLFHDRRSAGYQISARDVTEQKRLRELLVQAERLGAIGQVGIAVRHEINNPLTTVIGNVELLIERCQGRDPELVARLETVLNNALRIAEIVKQLQAIKKDKVVEYLQGVKMTDLRQK